MLICVIAATRYLVQLSPESTVKLLLGRVNLIIRGHTGLTNFLIYMIQ